MKALDDYLARIGVERPARPDRAGLDRIQEGHLLAVPFENLDIHLGIPISLALDDIVDKLVHRRRGGFCYEHNLLYASALGALGYEVRLLSAEMRQADGGFGPPFDHLCLEVQTEDGAVLADVGSGRGPLHPIAFAGDHWQDDGGGAAYRVVPIENDRLHVEVQGSDGTPNAVYRLDRHPHEPPEFDEMARWHQTSPESPFTQGWVCSRRLPGGRVTVASAGFVETIGDERSEGPITSVEELQTLLTDRFGMAPIEGLSRLWDQSGRGDTRFDPENG